MDELGTIGSIASIVALALTIGGIALRCLRSRQETHKIPICRYYVQGNVFTDRTESLEQLTSSVRAGKRVINVYGQRGIGKSALLKYYCDMVNKLLERKNVRQDGSKFRSNVKEAYYIELSGFASSDFGSQIANVALRDKDASWNDFLDRVSRRARRKKVLVVFDNVNNAALARQIESIISGCLACSDNVIVVVGSIEELALLSMDDLSQVETIPLDLFNEGDLFDFAEKNGRNISEAMLSQILDFSSGLPVFISLLLENSAEGLSPISYTSSRMKEYLCRILDDLGEEDRRLALHIGLLSASRPILPISLLDELACSYTQDSLIRLESSSLLELNGDEGTIRMHELIKNLICQIGQNETSIIKGILEYYTDRGMVYEQAYYLILLGDDQREHDICHAIDAAIEEENYSFLLLLGEHYKLFQDFSRRPRNGLSEESFLSIIYGYVEGLLGVGNYPAAREVVDKCKISTRKPDSEMQFRLSLSTAKLYQLENNYTESIATFGILLEESRNDARFSCHEAKCLWGIAHSMRHMGSDYVTALEYYDQSSNVGSRAGQYGIVLNNLREKMPVLLLLERFNEAKCLMEDINALLKTIPIDTCLPERISLKRAEATYLRVTDESMGIKSLYLTESALEDYKKLNKRLQYDAYFEIGEFYRLSGKYALACKNYRKGLVFSRKNKDQNMESFCLVALVLTAMADGKTPDNDIVTDMANLLPDIQRHKLLVNSALMKGSIAIARDMPADGDDITTLEASGYAAAANLFRRPSLRAFRDTSLFLM